MRIIKFRGRSIEDNKIWYYGYYYVEAGKMPNPIRTPKSLPVDEGTHWIVFPSFADWDMPREMQRVQVDPATVGEFIGSLDKNGVEIYEGDIVYSECCSPDDPAYGHYGETYKVECDAPNGGFNLRDFDGIYTEIDYPEGLEVRGKIYENPDMI